MREIDPSWHEPCTAQDLERARVDAMKAIVRPQDMPSPYDVARNLIAADPQAAAALVRAVIVHKPPYFGCYRVEEGGHVAVLRALGLVGSVGTTPDAHRAVGMFGLSVRKVLMADPMEEDVDGPL